MGSEVEGSAVRRGPGRPFGSSIVRQFDCTFQPQNARSVVPASLRKTFGCTTVRLYSRTAEQPNCRTAVTLPTEV
jgi:hypothetical protein